MSKLIIGEVIFVLVTQEHLDEGKLNWLERHDLPKPFGYFCPVSLAIQEVLNISDVCVYAKDGGEIEVENNVVKFILSPSLKFISDQNLFDHQEDCSPTSGFIVITEVQSIID